MERVVYLALDPVHIGAGGYRLGRVDMTIAREPGTNLPKIPGTSFNGAARSYAASMYGKPEAGGRQKGFLGDRKTCPICYTFGSASDDTGQAGVVTITDAHILLFPITSVRGPVWITTAAVLEDAGFTIGAGGVPATREQISTTMPAPLTELNLGWLLIRTVRHGIVLTPPAALLVKEPFNAFYNSIGGKIVVVHDSLFSYLVNTNLEVRTSVSINPKTGAAETGALFSYEAIPRATLLIHDLIEDNYREHDEPPFSIVEKKFKRNPKFDATKKNGEPDGSEREGDALTKPWTTPLEVARAGLGMIEMLGIGGMGTRGFGRVRLLGFWEVARG